MGYNRTSGEKGMGLKSSLIIAYLFLGGCGAGTLFVLAAMSLCSPRRDIEAPSSGRLRPTLTYARLYGLGYFVKAVDEVTSEPLLCAAGLVVAALPKDPL